MSYAGRAKRNTKTIIEVTRKKAKPRVNLFKVAKAKKSYG